MSIVARCPPAGVRAGTESTGLSTERTHARAARAETDLSDGR
ncbi:hypothetical protein [Collinsella intestinalis]|nr:hypothetical protein [Collinsella intestinalis]